MIDLRNEFVPPSLHFPYICDFLRNFFNNGKIIGAFKILFVYIYFQ